MHRRSLKILIFGAEMRKIIGFVILFFLISGCATSSRFNKTGAGMFAWKNDRSAALVVGKEEGDPKACMQFAMVANSISVEAQAKVANSLLALSGVVSKSRGAQEGGDDAERNAVAISGALESIASALNTTTERTSFLMVGSFYICQLQANGLANAEVSKLMLELIKQAATLQPSVGKNGAEEHSASTSHTSEAPANAVLNVMRKPDGNH